MHLCVYPALAAVRCKWQLKIDIVSKETTVHLLCASLQKRNFFRNLYPVSFSLVKSAGRKIYVARVFQCKGLVQLSIIR